MALDVGPIPDQFWGIVGFDIKTPCDEATIRANIASARARGLAKVVDFETSLRVIANGPSARLADLGQSWRDTLALNGAINLFVEKGLAPTYWACCDPQALVADLLPDQPPRATTYLVASKCHPSVFDKLAGCHVVVWDVGDFVEEGRPVPCASSITSCVPALMLRRGYSRFEFWGWDCSFGEGDAHHAVDQDHQPPEVITIECDGRDFRTTRSWLAEAQDFGNQLKPVFDWLGVEIALQGDGFLRAFLSGSQAVFHPDKQGT